ncbi:MAG: DegT/DnrJ/EryC1/StrS family aminotransferase [Patescibacteria group bacterium]|jgi:dTDP-4-amino-4,6-dideoxygalactose transaminase
MPNESKKYIVFGSPYIGKEEIAEMAKTLKSGWIGTGPKAARFENDLCRYTGARYGLALNSCTAGLHLSLLVSGIGPGDEVITTPLTFCATVNTIIHSGARPVFIDVDPKTMNMDANRIEEAITKHTKAIMPVHLAGRPCEMDKITQIARKYKLLVIEDAAQAIGSEYKGRKIGSIGDLTCFSFYVTKNIITGEGGMVMTDNKEFADKIKVYALHGMSKDAWKRFSDDGYRHYQVIFPGYKYNMTDMQASLGIHQLKRIGRFDKKRQKIWDQYNAAFFGLPIGLPAPIGKDIHHNKHLYTLLVDKKKAGVSRDEFMRRLHERGIGTGVHYIPVHLHQYYRERFGYKPGGFPNAEYIGERTVSIPLSARLTKEEIKRIIKAVKEAVLNK